MNFYCSLDSPFVLHSKTQNNEASTLHDSHILNPMFIHYAYSLLDKGCHTGKYEYYKKRVYSFIKQLHKHKFKWLSPTIPYLGTQTQVGDGKLGTNLATQ